MEQQNPTQRLDKRIWISLGLYAGLIILHQFLIQPSLIRLTSDAPVINIAGRQRMLSQKLAKEALAIMNTSNSATREHLQSELASTLQLWRTAHFDLQAGKSRSFFDRGITSTIQAGFLNVEPHFQAMSSAAEAILAGSDNSTASAALDSMLSNESEFLNKMHSLVGLYEDEAQRHVGQLQSMGLIIMIVILVILLAIQFGVLRPELSIVGTEWKQNEARYQLLVESMTDGLVVFDSQGRVKFANQRFCDMLHQDLDRMIGQPASNLITDLDRRQFEGLLLGTRNLSGPFDLKLRSANAHDVETMISPRRMSNLRGNFEGLLLVVTDVTSRKIIELRSRELQTQLAHADRLKSMGTMAAALAHEINQPLGAISNYAEGCLARLSGNLTNPQELAVPLRAILRASHRGGEIVRRTKDFARPQPHQLTLESVNHLVREVEELCQPEARRRCVSIETNLADNLLAIEVDGIQIQQVLTNLIQNAFIALDQVEAFRRKIKLTTIMRDDNLLEISIADSGPGVPAMNAQSLFEPFVTNGKNGTGLGLTIARGIIESHGGQIWYEVSQEGGANFRFTLPIAPTWETDNESFKAVAAAEFETQPNLIARRHTQLEGDLRPPHAALLSESGFADVSYSSPQAGSC